MNNYYWNSIPIGKQNALDYEALQTMWGMNQRSVRYRLHELSLYDNGDNYVLIRSSKNRGFYRTDDEEEIRAYRKECLAKGRSIFAPVRKCNRILNTNSQQFTITNNLLLYRCKNELKQTDVCKWLNDKGFSIDPAMLSKFENNRALPLPSMTEEMAELYGCRAGQLIVYEIADAI